MRRSTWCWALCGGAVGVGCQFPDYAFLPCEPGTVSCTADGAAPAGDAGDGGVACAPPIASDTFSRAEANGLGAAEVGGTWKVSAGDVASVADGGARVVLNAGTGGQGLLELSVLDVEESVVVTTDKPSAPSDAGTGGIFVYLHGRRISSATSYWVGLWITESNTVRLGITRLIRGEETTLALSNHVPGIAYVPGMRLQVRATYEGTFPTKLRGKVWKAEESEPTAWTIEASDNTPELQAAGGVAMRAYLTVRATNAPVTVTFDDFVARASGSCGR